MILTITDVLMSLEKSCTISNNDYSTLVWNDSSPKPTLEELETKRDQMQADYDSKQYQIDRASQYPSIQDQLDMLYHQGIDGWKAEIKKVKDAHPKPEST